jgi:hypothetical protein
LETPASISNHSSSDSPATAVSCENEDVESESRHNFYLPISGRTTLLNFWIVFSKTFQNP